MTLILCRSCGGTVDPLLSFGPQPIVNRLLANAEQDYSRYPMSHGVCTACGLLQNTSPIEPSVFYKNYDTPSSWKPEPHLPRLIAEIVKVLPLDARILDVGCNDGKFMAALSAAGFRNVVGIEPSENTAITAREEGHEVVTGYFGDDLSQEILDRFGPIDAIISRQVLEHVGNLNEFMSAANNALTPDGVLILEVPDSSVNIYENDFSLWEEHINFFTEQSLTQLLQRNHFKNQFSYKSLFSGRCLTIFAVRETQNAGTDTPSDVNILLEIIAAQAMSTRYQELKARLSQEVSSIAALHDIVLLGVGSRSCTQVNLLNLGQWITRYVDDSPDKQGRWVPGVQLCVAPFHQGVQELGRKPFVLLGVNAENEGRLIDRLNLTPGVDCASILPPSHFLLDSWSER